DSFRYGLQIFSASTNRILNYDVLDTVVVGPDAICSGAPEAEYPAMDDIVFNRLMMREGHPRLGIYMANRGGTCQMLNSVIHSNPGQYAFEAERIDTMTLTNCR